MNEIMEMKTDMVSRLATMFMEKHPGMSMEEALNAVFNSNTYRKLMNSDTHLYHQSTGYVYAFLEEELSL